MTRQEILKNAKPILFNTEMVRAILDGRKTVTRRVMKPQPKSKLCYAFAGSHKKDIGRWEYPSKTAHEFWGEEFKLPDVITEEELKKKWNPPYHADDILYVRETWSPLHQDKDSKDVCGYMYKACTLEEYDKMYPDGKDYQWEGKWHPSIHMPKEAARVFLKVTNVRVERLQDAKYFDFINEGIPYKQYECEIREDFQKLWNYTIKKSDLYCYGWDANPWVWVIEFERIEV